ncbi:MAG TPA: VOC family protein [Solirubrobacteraceae bacterium]|nr:VOC family protein [Solirubrobacteraceae bacterium]
MKPSINAITLGVDDLERAVRFYRDGLGLPTNGIFGTEFAGSADEPSGAVAMFTLENGLILAVYPRSELAKDARVDQGSVLGSGVSIGHAVGSRSEVDALLAAAERAGAVITVPARERPWGIYAGYFRDPDGHLWEILHFLPTGPSEDPARPN